jgi:hypothetical protein
MPDWMTDRRQAPPKDDRQDLRAEMRTALLGALDGALLGAVAGIAYGRPLMMFLPFTFALAGAASAWSCGPRAERPGRRTLRIVGVVVVAVAFLAYSPMVKVVLTWVVTETPIR